MTAPEPLTLERFIKDVAHEYPRGGLVWCNDPSIYPSKVWVILDEFGDEGVRQTDYARRWEDLVEQFYGHAVAARDEAAEISPGAEIDDSNALKGAIVAVLENESYQTPYGTYNCRFCDLNLDDMGTGEDMHSADCLIRTLRSVLAATEGKKGVK